MGPDRSDEEHYEPAPDDLVGDYEPIEPARWRRNVLVAIAAVTALAIAAVPIYNLIQARDRPIADNGLEVCGFDYCVIQDIVVAAGLGDTMSRLAVTFLNDTDAEDFAVDLQAHLGSPPSGFEMVDRLAGDISGEYSPDTDTIRVERPARAWIILHEVAHVGTNGHGADFRETLIDLAIWMDEIGG